MRAAVFTLCLLSAVAFSACNHDSPTDPTKLVTSLQPADSERYAFAGLRGLVRVRVLDERQQPLAGIRVSWEAP